MTRISVVIPCRNERVLLERCLDALLAQDMPRHDFEVIVVDGGSSDGSDALAVERGAIVLRDPGSGPAFARNVGIARARGEIVAFTDADCVPRFDWLTRLDEAFRADAEVAAAAGAMRLPRASFLGRTEDNDARVHYRGFITSNIAYRREVLEELGGFDESLRCAEDYDLAWRALDAGFRIARVEDAVVLHAPPEIEGRIAAYLAKQFWYARHDVLAHVRALARARRGAGSTPGSQQAVTGLVDALVRSSTTAGLVGALALRSRGLFLATAGVALGASTRRVALTAAKVGEGAREVPKMALLELAKGAARGAGTLVGLAELARPSSLAALRRPAPASWARRSAPSLRAPSGA